MAIHRKHYAATEIAEDPHSPQVRGIRKVLLEGAELYRLESESAATVAQYDAETLQAVITHRYDVLARFARALQRGLLRRKYAG